MGLFDRSFFKSPKPVYLWIHDGEIEIRDASHLWGKDTFETPQIIREELGDEEIKVACIGPAGENQVTYAAIIVDRFRAAGRAGGGTVMGSKNLKAIAVKGTKVVPIVQDEPFTKAAKVAYKMAIEKEGSGREKLICDDLTTSLFSGIAHYFNPKITLIPYSSSFHLSMIHHFLLFNLSKSIIFPASVPSGILFFPRLYCLSSSLNICFSK
jgi:hypothetical protein